MFVVNDGKVYVISDELVDPNLIGSKIGEVTKYSDMEGTYSGNFSNRYPKGTDYYEIEGVDVNDAIAVKERLGLFIKANYNGEYAGGKDDAQNLNLGTTIYKMIIIGIPLSIVASVTYLTAKRKNKLR